MEKDSCLVALSSPQCIVGPILVLMYRPQILLLFRLTVCEEFSLMESCVAACCVVLCGPSCGCA